MSEAEIGILATKLEAFEILMVERFKRLEDKFDMVVEQLKTKVEDHIETETPWQEAINNRLIVVENKPGKDASQLLKWLITTVGIVLISGALSLVGLGLIHTLEANPNIGNTPQSQSTPKP